LEIVKGLETGLILVRASCCLFFSIGRWILFYFFFEISLIPTLWLILKWGYQPERLQAGVFMIIYTAGASLPLLLSLLFIYGVAGRDSFILRTLTDRGSWFSRWFLIPILLAFLVKLPIYGFHVWLPKAHVEAPLAGSMVLAGVLLKLGGFGLIRVIRVVKATIREGLLLVITFSVWGGLLSSLISMVQRDIKSIIAYSSVGHISLVVIRLISCYPIAKIAAVCIIFAHGVCSPCMFALAASTYDWSQSRRVVINKNVLRIFPNFSFFWFSFIIANIGCPPSINFFSEVIIFRRIKEMRLIFIIPLGFLCEFTCVYCVFLYGFLNHGGVTSFLNPHIGLSDRYLIAFIISFVSLFGRFFGLDYIIL